MRREAVEVMWWDEDDDEDDDDDNDGDSLKVGIMGCQFDINLDIDNLT